MPATKVFPQLASGAITQYPLRSKEYLRTLVNQTADGRRIRYADVGASMMAWEMTQSALSDEEWTALETLFRACEGRRHSFLFLDPWSNLVASSEDFGNAAWQAAPGLGLSSGVQDPEGRPRATQVTNSAAGLQSLSQSLSVPANFQYSFSVYARAASTADLRLIVSADGAFAERLFELSANWQRYTLFSALSSTAESLEVAMQLPAGVTVELFGTQMEAQPAPSPYQRTGLRTGRYPETRFAGDTLTQVSTSPGEHSTVVRILSRANGST
ncbi:MAG: DUF2460 domain-containing protein [Bryobacteraceae bacterium]|nr:DUF2460 domain-containing protein [Bryobacteraceae bacterium]